MAALNSLTNIPKITLSYASLLAIASTNFQMQRKELCNAHSLYKPYNIDDRHYIVHTAGQYQ